MQVWSELLQESQYPLVNLSRGQKWKGAAIAAPWRLKWTYWNVFTLPSLLQESIFQRWLFLTHDFSGIKIWQSWFTQYSVTIKSCSGRHNKRFSLFGFLVKNLYSMSLISTQKIALFLAVKLAPARELSNFLGLYNFTTIITAFAFSY